MLIASTNVTLDRATAVRCTCM